MGQLPLHRHSFTEILIKRRISRSRHTSLAQLHISPGRPGVSFRICSVEEKRLNLLRGSISYTILSQSATLWLAFCLERKRWSWFPTFPENRRVPSCRRVLESAREAMERGLLALLPMHYLHWHRIPGNRIGRLQGLVLTLANLGLKIGAEG